MAMNMEQLEAKIKEVSAASVEKSIEAYKAELAGKSMDANQINELVTAKVKELEIDESKKASTRAETMAIYEAAIASAETKGATAPNGKDMFLKMLVANAKALDVQKVKNFGQLDKDVVLDVMRKCYPEEKAMYDIMKKTATAGIPSAGGFGIPQVLLPEVIEYLHADSILANLGVRKVPMVNGNFTMPRIDATSAAYWINETENITPSDLGFGQVNLRAKKMAASAFISNSAIRQNVIGLDRLISDELRENASALLDEAFLYGAGTENSPRGLKNVSGITTLGSTSTALGLTTPIDMLAEIEQKNVKLRNPKWIFSPLGKAWLRSKAFSTGPFAWADEMARSKTVEGIPYITSSTVAVDPTSKAYSDFWLLDAAQILWGVAYDLELEISREASFTSGGNTINAFQQDLTIVRVIGEHDFGVRHPEAIVYGQYSKV